MKRSGRGMRARGVFGPGSRVHRGLPTLGVLAGLMLMGCGRPGGEADPSSPEVGVVLGSVCGSGNAALGRPIKASSTSDAALPASAAVDGNSSTRWSSVSSDAQWLEVDLGSSQPICQVTLQWETAYARAFQIQVSNDETNWTTVYSTTTGTGGTQTLPVTGTGRYVRMNATQRGTIYGYSLFELQVQATPTPIYPRPGQMTGSGVLPAQASKTTYLGPVKSANGNFARDLGFSGVVNGQIIWTFGDTLLPTQSNPSQYAFCSNDSAALGNLQTPLLVSDKNLTSSGCTQQWIPFTSGELSTGGGSRWAEGGTNVVEYAPNKGLVWFLKNDRQQGSDSIVGAGVATVTADASGPKALRPMDTMWNSFEPYWGDIGVTFNPLDNNVYVFGHGPASANLGANVYLAKVPAASAQDVSAYQYWDQSKKAWTTARFANGQLGTVNVSDAQALFTYYALGQSNAFWSNYYNTWMFVYGTGWPTSDIMVMTASKLEGPWSTPVSITSTCPTGSCGNLRYAITPHPEYDLSGKTLLVTWTDANVVYSTRIEWK